MFKLRNYDPRDFEYLYKLDQQCFTAGIAYSRSELSSYVSRKNSFTLVADYVPDVDPDPTNPAASRPRIAGFITVEITSKAYGHIITIDVHPDYRRHGLATTMMNAAEEELRERDAFMAVLEVAVNNQAALKFYEKFGYKTVRTLPKYYDGKVDGLFMTKRL